MGKLHPLPMDGLASALGEIRAVHLRIFRPDILQPAAIKISIAQIAFTDFHSQDTASRKARAHAFAFLQPHATEKSVVQITSG